MLDLRLLFDQTEAYTSSLVTAKFRLFSELFRDVKIYLLVFNISINKLLLATTLT